MQPRKSPAQRNQERQDKAAAEQRQQAAPNKVTVAVPSLVSSPGLPSAEGKGGTGVPSPVGPSADTKSPAVPKEGEPSPAKLTPTVSVVEQKDAAPKTDPLAEMKGLAEFTPRPNPDQLFADERFSYQLVSEDDAALKFEQGLKGFLSTAKAVKRDAVKDLFGGRLFQTPKAKDDQQKLPRSAVVMTQYAPLLKRGAIPERLMAEEDFASLYDLRADPANTQRVKVFDKKAGLVAVLLLGNAEAYRTVAEATETKRAGLSKQHVPGEEPTHVADDAGVPTRRFAFFETSRQQLMAALGDGAEGKLKPALRGRYIRHRLAMGLPADVKDVDPDIAQIFGLDPKAPAKPDQVAAIHQYLGSGMPQRGISLTSTPKTQVYSNDGDLFASPDGVRIKVDLSLVPKDVMLLNHYAEGGVGSRLAADPRFPRQMVKKPDTEVRGRSYNYAASVVKNRELLLKELRPEWIVEITDHLKDTRSAPVRGPAAPEVKAPEVKTATAAATGSASSGTGKSGPAQSGPQKSGQARADAKGSGSGSATAPQLGAEPKSLDQKIAAMKDELGHSHYEAGRQDGLAGKKSDKSTHTGPVAGGSYDAGFGAGAEERQGMLDAKVDIPKFWVGFKAWHNGDKIPPISGGPSVEHMGAAAAKFASQQEQQQATGAQADWFVLCWLRREISATFPMDGGDAMVKFRPKMHDTYWLGWASAVRISKEEQARAEEEARKKMFKPHTWGAPKPAASTVPVAQPQQTTSPPRGQQQVSSSGQSRGGPGNNNRGGTSKTGPRQ